MNVVPSVHTSHRPARRDQRKLNDAAGEDTDCAAVAWPPAGTGPNRKPMTTPPVGQ